MVHRCDCSGMSSYMLMQHRLDHHCCGGGLGFGSIWSYGQCNTGGGFWAGAGMGLGVGLMGLLNNWLGGWSMPSFSGWGMPAMPWGVTGGGNTSGTNGDYYDRYSSSLRGGAPAPAATSGVNEDYSNLVDIQSEVKKLQVKSLGTVTPEEIKALKEKLETEKNNLDKIQDDIDLKMINNLLAELDDLQKDNDALANYTKESAAYNQLLIEKQEAENKIKELEKLTGKSAEEIQQLENELKTAKINLEEATKKLTQYHDKIAISADKNTRLVYANGHIIRNIEDVRKLTPEQISEFNEFDALMILGMLGFLKKDQTTAQSHTKLNTSKTNGYLCGKLTHEPNILRLMNIAKISTEFYHGSGTLADNAIVGYPQEIQTDGNGKLVSYEINCELAGQGSYRYTYQITLKGNDKCQIKIMNDECKLIGDTELNYNEQENIYTDGNFKVQNKK